MIDSLLLIVSRLPADASRLYIESPQTVGLLAIGVLLVVIIIIPRRKTNNDVWGV